MFLEKEMLIVTFYKYNTLLFQILWSTLLLNDLMILYVFLNNLNQYYDWHKKDSSKILYVIQQLATNTFCLTNPDI